MAGEVKNAGQFNFIPVLTVKTAVAMAGGYTTRAYLAEARLLRQGQGPRLSPTCQGVTGSAPGDKLYVPERGF